MNIKIENVTLLSGEAADVYTGGGKILSIGEKPDGFSAEKTVAGSDKLAIPALFNCHTHAYMSLFRNIADDLPFDKWLFGKIMPLEDALTPGDAFWGAMLSCAEMLKSGCGCFCDMNMFPGASADAAEKTGMRAVISRGLTDSDGAAAGERRLAQALREYAEYNGRGLLSFMLAPHAIYTCSEKYLRRIALLAEEKGLGLNIHLSETRTEVADCYKEKNCSPVRYLESIGFFNAKTIAAHCVHVSPEDMEILVRNGVSIVLNPKSNLKLGNGVAPAAEMDDAGVNLCLGTDSAASNNSLNIFSEMSFTALLHKGRTENAEALPAARVFDFAVKNAAAALNLPDSGKLEPGASADLTLIDLNTPAFSPRNGLLNAVCYSANGSEVSDVMINGEMVLENKKLTRADEEEIYFHAEKIMKKLR